MKPTQRFRFFKVQHKKLHLRPLTSLKPNTKPHDYLSSSGDITRLRINLWWKGKNSHKRPFSPLTITKTYVTLQNSPCSQARCPSNAIVCIVLPRPISSARIPFNLRSCKVASQSKPTCWYSRKECFSKNGTNVFTWKHQMSS